MTAANLMLVSLVAQYDASTAQMSVAAIWSTTRRSFRSIASPHCDTDTDTDTDTDIGGMAVSWRYSGMLLIVLLSDLIHTVLKTHSKLI